MDYYLCNKDTAPQLAATQGDAKALDKKFTPFSVDTAKKPLMEFVNALLNGTHELVPTHPEKCVVSIPDDVDDVDDKTLESCRQRFQPIPAINCPACHRTPIIAKSMAEDDALDEVKGFILERIDARTSEYLDRIEEAIAARRRQLTATAAEAPTPPKRKRA
jgi:uncharacterized protein YlaI